MTLASRAKRVTYLTHRWTAVAGCVLMALWFISGIVMLYVGYPKLTPWERLAAQPALPAGAAYVSTQRLLTRLNASTDSVILTSVAGSPAYVLQSTKHRSKVFSAKDGRELEATSPEHAVIAADMFAPGGNARYLGLVHEDRWTHARGLDVHRPLHRVQIQGNTPGTLYVSSVTGQVVLDAPVYQQRWNYVGAWLHWLYMFRDYSVDPAWSWLVIALSALCTLSAVTGMVVGLWRWRFRERYKTGSRTPYRERWMRWHHINGLLFGVIVVTWTFSGLMSMNPFGLFSPSHPRPNLTAYQGKPQHDLGSLTQPLRIIQALHNTGFTPVELHWRHLNAETFVLAYDRQADTRLVRKNADDTLAVSNAWAIADVMPAAQRLFDYPVLDSTVIAHDDLYYYRRHPEAMNGARQLGFPALGVDFADPGNTRAYIDLQTGAVTMSLDARQRVGRWLFYFLHSWDMPGLLRAGMGRDLAIIALSLGGLVVSLAGMVIAWRRVRQTVKRGLRL